MKQKQLESKAYMKPRISVCDTQTECLLTSASGNAGTISPGTGGGDAKQGWFEEEEDIPQDEASQAKVWEN